MANLVKKKRGMGKTRRYGERENNRYREGIRRMKIIEVWNRKIVGLLVEKAVGGKYYKDIEKKFLDFVGENIELAKRIEKYEREGREREKYLEEIIRKSEISRLRKELGAISLMDNIMDMKEDTGEKEEGGGKVVRKKDRNSFKKEIEKMMIKEIKIGRRKNRKYENGGKKKWEKEMERNYINDIKRGKKAEKGKEL